ncbi:MAG: S-adenosylmethionine decarboxylase [Rhabdochlamydiaceae bacterium]|nr:S-adenosylmethionine decarboxylase [Candidatus Amphrikana amoebophyrae]
MKKIILALALIAMGLGLYSAFFIDHPILADHYTASFKGCDRDVLKDHQKLKFALIDSARSAGAKVYDLCETRVNEEGYAVVLLLEKSHASLRSLDEKGICVVDLLAFDQTLDCKLFDKNMRAYLKPEAVHKII